MLEWVDRTPSRGVEVSRVGSIPAFTKSSFILIPLSKGEIPYQGRRFFCGRRAVCNTADIRSGEFDSLSSLKWRGKGNPRASKASRKEFDPLSFWPLTDIKDESAIYQFCLWALCRRSQPKPGNIGGPYLIRGLIRPGSSGSLYAGECLHRSWLHNRLYRGDRRCFCICCFSYG